MPTVIGVRVKIDENIVETNVARVFRSVNPITFRNNVNLMLTDGRKIRLYCGTAKEAAELTENIRGGRATDPTVYSAKWNL